MCIRPPPDTQDRSSLLWRPRSFQTVTPTSSSNGSGRGSRSSRKTCPSRDMLSVERTTSAERRQRRCSKICVYRKRSVFCLPDKHTAAVTTAHRRGARGRRTRLSLHRFMLQTRSVTEVSVMVVDGICLMLTDSSPDKCSQSNSVSEYIRHFYVCNTSCGSFFFFVGKTGNTHPRHS